MMSGSRTDIFSPNGTSNTTSTTASTGASTMNVTVAQTPNNSNTEEKNTPRNRTTVPIVFKLALIAEVKKRDIIWQDLKEKKNYDLLVDAWQKVRKALRVKQTGFCEKQWKLLCHSYRNHVNRNTPMNTDLIREMAFLAPQLKKPCSDKEQPDTETGEPEQPSSLSSPKPKKVATQAAMAGQDTVTGDSDKVTKDERETVAMLRLLFSGVQPDIMKTVKHKIVETLITILPDVEAKISEHAKKQVALLSDLNKIDWSTLDVPADVCKAVWDYKLMKALLTM